ncbi:MAG: HDIG domain-containing protein [Candidatus Celaenobacter antarcticus]|nr:HDIG domain-containing protein [Candidatus Celaenobacter antarcticus]
MKREEALTLLKTHLKNRNLQKHCLAVEAAMAHFAEYFDEDTNMWALAGLLHDLDYESTVNNFARHGKDSVELLKDKGLDEKILYAIEAHPGHVERKSNMDKVLYAVDSLTGLIVAAALMHPGKKISSLDTNFVMRRFKEKRFAAGANREQIKSCEEFGMSLEDFIEHTLQAMAGIEKELGF